MVRFHKDGIWVNTTFRTVGAVSMQLLSWEISNTGSRMTDRSLNWCKNFLRFDEKIFKEIGIYSRMEIWQCPSLDNRCSLEQEVAGMKARRATPVCRTFIEDYALGLKNIYQYWFNGCRERRKKWRRIPCNK